MVENDKMKINQETTKNKASGGKINISSIGRFLFKEPRKEGQSNTMHNVRQIGRAICVGCIFIFIPVLLINNSNLTESVAALLFFPALISFLMWKWKKSQSDNNSYYPHNKDNINTNPAYSSLLGNIHNSR